MRILLITSNLDGTSGWGRYAADLARALGKRGHEVRAVVSKRSRGTMHRAPTGGLALIRCEKNSTLRKPTSYLGNPLLCALHAWKLQRRITQWNPDVIHCIAEPYALLLPFLRLRKSCVTVLTLHSTYALLPLGHGGLTGWLMHLALKKMDRIIAVSHFTKNAVVKAVVGAQHRGVVPLHEEKITVIHNAVDLDRFPWPLPAREENPVKRIIGVGAVKARKGYLHAIETCAAFKKISPIPFRYEIFGALDEDVPYVADIRRAIADRNLEECVQLRGPVSDAELQEAYRTADLFLLLSIEQGVHAEGFGLVFLEANAHGVPVIGPRSGGCPEAIAEGVSGFVCDPKNPDAVAARMVETLSGHAIDPQKCRRWAEEHSAGAWAEAIVEQYQR